MKKLRILFAFATLCLAPSHAVTAQTPAPQSSNDAQVTGDYVADDGEVITVKIEANMLKLKSGPSIFTLSNIGNGRYKAIERDLIFTFAGDFLSVAEGGRLVATASRGQVPETVIEPQNDMLLAWLDANIPTLLARYRIPAAAIARIDGDRVTFTRVYGERRKGKAANLDTLFNVASLTKPIAAETLLRLASAGKIDIDKPMAPDWIDPDIKDDPRALQLTIRMALRHRTGLPNWRTDTSNLLAFAHEPNTGFHYSGEGYTYAARYAERMTGQNFEALAKHYVFGPIGMKNTTFTVASQWKEKAAYPHDSRGRELWPVLRLDYSAACCLHTTIGDYAKFFAVAMQGRALSQALRQQRFVPGIDQRDEMCSGDGLAPEMCPKRIAMGLGWMVFGFGADTVITHTGINDGERSAAFYVPEKRFGIVIFTNGANGTRLIRDVTAAAYDNAEYRRLTAYLAR
jgi:CubicO group peptidase (beta-lactamase class C family)